MANRWTLGLFFGLLGWAGSAVALQEFYSLSRTPRALAMGNAFYGLSDDEGALFYNPAGLALIRNGRFYPLNVVGGVSGNGSTAGRTVVNALQDSDDVGQVVERLEAIAGQVIHGSATVSPFYARRGFAVGLLLADAKANVGLLGRDLASELDVTGIVDSGLLVGKSFSPGKGGFHWGVTAKLLARAGGRRLMTALDFVQGSEIRFEELGGAGWGLDADVGALWTPSPRFGVGVAVNHLVATTFPWARREGQPPQLTRTFSLGGFWRTGSWTWRADLAEFRIGGQTDPDLGARTGSFWKHVQLGTEWKVAEWLFLRGGLYQGYPTAGMGVSLPFLKLDFATYDSELFSRPGALGSRRYVVRLALGYGA